MRDELGAYLDSLEWCAEETAVWFDGAMPLKINDYLTQKLPPQEFVTSVRCLVFQDEQVLTIFDHDGSKHILPGGRREAGETLEETGRREVLEETGWALGALQLVGVRHFEHQSPCPPNHPYPCPHFLQLVYAGTAVSHHPNAMQFDQYVTGCQFFPVADVQQVPLSKGVHTFLNAVLSRRG